MADIARTDPCGCGSGQAFEECCISAAERLMSAPRGLQPIPQFPRGFTLDDFTPMTPEDYEFVREFTRQTQRALVGPPDLLKTPFNGGVVRTFGDGFTWRKPTESFHEFCVWALKITFGQEWLDEQFALAEGDRHVVAKWLMDLFRLQTRDTPPDHIPGLTVASQATGSAQELVLLGRDLIYLAQIGKLPDRLVARLRKKSEFQGAWYEIRVASVLIHGGYEIEWIENKSESHCEFTARHRFTQETFAVEVKSRHRPGLLNQAGDREEDPRVLADRNFRAALEKDTQGLPLLVFVDVNMPLSNSLEDAARLWAQHMANFIHPMGLSPSEPAKFAYAVCTNFSYHQYGDAPIQGMPIVYDKFPMFSVRPCKVPELARHAVEEGLKQVGSLPPPTL
jgi:hypothetical protein